MKKLITICAVFLFVASIVNADVTEYYDRTDWEAAAVAAYLIETFDDAALNPEISVDSGSWNVDLWEDQVSISPSNSATWSFAPPIYAFGADWDLGYNGHGSGIQVSIGGDAITTLQYFDGFWGVVSTEPFSTVLLDATSYNPGIETFRLDNMVYTTEKPAIIVDVDIKGGSCPNPFNPKSKGSVPVAILASDDYVLADIDPATIMLIGVAALDEWIYEDSTQPGDYDPMVCDDCFDADDPANFNCDLSDDDIDEDDAYCGDEIDELVVKFDTRELAAAIAAAGGAEKGQCLELFLTGETVDGIPIEGSDSVVVLKAIAPAGP